MKPTIAIFPLPPPLRRIPNHWYWSFHMVNPAPPTAFAEIIFHSLFIPVLHGPLAPTIQLGINDIVAISAGSTLYQQYEVAAFEDGLPQLDVPGSAGLGPTAVNVANGQAALTQLNLKLVNGPGPGWYLYLQLQGANQAAMNWNGTSTGSGGGTWVNKSSWASVFPTAFAQPSGGEFPQ